MKKLFFLILLAFTGTACTRVYYPQTTPAITVEEQGEIQLEGGASLASLDFIPGAYGAITVAPFKNVAIQGFASVFPGAIEHIELAAGYGNKLGEYSRWGIYGGFARAGVLLERRAYGRMLNDYYLSYHGNYNLYFTRLQLQLKPRNVYMGLNLKLGVMEPQFVRDAYLEPYDFHTDDNILYSTYEYNRARFFAEPVFYIGGKIRESLGLNMYYSFTFMDRTTLEIEEVDWGFPNSMLGNFGLSLTIYIDTFKKKTTLPKE